MSFFDDDDPFEDIVSQFFGNHPGVRKSRVRRVRDEEEQNTQFIEEDNKIYCITELPGYNEKEIQLEIRDNMLIVSARTINNSEKQSYLAQKHKEGITIQQIIPSKIKTKNFTKTFKNGVLEISFDKK